MTNLLTIMLLDAAPAAAQPAAGSGWYTPAMLVLMIVVFYFFFIRPQMKRSKEQKKFKENLQKDQKIITIGGVHGKIVEIQDSTVTIEIAPNVRVRVEKSAIAMDNTQTIESK